MGQPFCVSDLSVTATEYIYSQEIDLRVLIRDLHFGPDAGLVIGCPAVVSMGWS